MKVKDLMQLLRTLDQNFDFDVSSGDLFGDIDPMLSRGTKKDGTKTYIAYTKNMQKPQERYK